MVISGCGSGRTIFSFLINKMKGRGRRYKLGSQQHPRRLSETSGSSSSSSSSDEEDQQSKSSHGSSRSSVVLKPRPRQGQAIYGTAAAMGPWIVNAKPYRWVVCNRKSNQSVGTVLTSRTFLVKYILSWHIIHNHPILQRGNPAARK